jgi:hypothetical protein
MRCSVISIMKPALTRAASQLAWVSINRMRASWSKLVSGFIERQEDGADRRVRHLQLTSEGSKLVRLGPRTRAANNRLLAALDPAERDQFVYLLVRVVESNAILDRRGAGRRKRAAAQSALSEK